MTTRQHISRMKKNYDRILAYIEDDRYSEKMLSHLIQIFEKSNIRNNLHEVKATLYIILKISNNHHRGPNFFSKIEEILKYFKDQIKNYFSNSEIFNIFKSNKRLLLFFISEKIMIFDEYVFSEIRNKYEQYFAPEIKQFAESNHIDYTLKDLPENFDQKRKQGEIDNVICEIIRNDSIVEFKSYIKNHPDIYEILDDSSIFETNPLLFKKKVHI